MRQTVEGRKHELIVTLPRDSIYLNADPTRLEQVVGNLLANAIKYTESQGRITLEVGQDRDEAVIRVRDNGIGIPSEALSHIFAMFAQVEGQSPRSKGGLGIGLGLVKSLVEMHGGSISAHSEGPAQGSEFVVRLPALPSIPAAQAGPERDDPEANMPNRRRRILVVDDNVDAARSLARLLTRLYGQDTRVAHDGPQALALAEEFRPDVVLLDIGMPGMDGHEVARRLRVLPEFNGGLIVALTGWGQESDRRRSDDAGIDYHLVKPANPETIVDLLIQADKSKSTTSV
jgi:two-component system CheB/CheR fusion protein